MTLAMRSRRRAGRERGARGRAREPGRRLRTRTRTTRAVDGVSLSIGAGEIVGLAGESGCGKSTLGNAVMQVLRPPAQVTERTRAVRRRGRRRAEPRGAAPVPLAKRLDGLPERDERTQPGHARRRPVRRHDARARARVEERARSRVPATCSTSSGSTAGGSARTRTSSPAACGQRVVIAMALALRPELVIMDEPTTALDVVVQREILQQVRELQAELGFAVLFITHDLSLLLELAQPHRDHVRGRDRRGRARRAARASTRATRTRSGLLELVPAAPRARSSGSPVSPARRPTSRAPPSGCRFHPRCPHCMRRRPALYQRQVGERPLLRVVAPRSSRRLPREEVT